ncbi:helix-turn-helix transcriptional regulator [Cupriavidus basilensis]
MLPGLTEAFPELESTRGRLKASGLRLSYASPVCSRFISHECGSMTRSARLAGAQFCPAYATLPTVVRPGVVASAYFGPFGSASWWLVEHEERADLEAVLIGHAKLHVLLDTRYMAAASAYFGNQRLTEREAQALSLTANGKSSREIGEKLGISARTADHYIDEARRKLGAQSRAEAVFLAMRSGLFRVEPWCR